MTLTIPLNDLARQPAALALETDAVARQVEMSGWYILEPQLEAFQEVLTLPLKSL